MAEGGGQVSEEELVAKRGSSSVIWNWFGFKQADTEQKVVLCKVCRQTVTSKDSNTTNLFHHLKHKHKPEYEASQKMRYDAAEALALTSKAKKPTTTQTKLADAFVHSTPYDSQSKRWKALTEAVAFCLAKDMLPLRTVEKDGFRRMIHKMDARYKLPSRKYFSNTALPKMYEECRDGLQTKLSTVTFFASTTDMWSSRATEPYISFTVHYIADWSLKSSCLQTSFFPEDHTGENIASGLKQFLQEWKLDEAKQVCLTTDSGANVVKAVALNKWTRLSCFGHNLHIAVERSMRDNRIDRAVG
ncbi:zinc finger BED domain-containing protein 1, partial [Austrofundulus limnaeus]|uniref:Zinc finger BED domain-containing protein 1 n=1 Tax=Austrofundulus limnaeus TaxID=52670 RepID=A0A2I4AX12_AUSLI